MRHRGHELELLAGEADSQQLLRAAEGGLFVPEIDQGALDPASGEVVLHAPWGRLIRGGELAEVCGPFQLRGRVPELLAAIAAVTTSLWNVTTYMFMCAFEALGSALSLNFGHVA